LQYHEWKEKDEQIVTDAYVEDIEKAILLSKIDFEEHKATMKVIKEEEAKLALLESSKKPKTMSLDQFHQLDNNNSKESELNTIFIHQNETNLPKTKYSPNESVQPSDVSIKKTVGQNLPDISNGTNEEFFSKHHEDVKNAINQEEKLNSTRNMSVTKNGMALNESALMEQFKATVALKDSEISKIHAENEKLATELKKIKNRYKGMRTILDEAELKEKVAILLEVEQLRKDRDEMSKNVAQLTEELEQSKTREHLLGKELRSLQEKHSKNSQGGSHSISDKS